MQRTIHIIYASTGGHTEFVVETLAAYLTKKQTSLNITRQRAEQAEPDDLHRGDVLLLASGSWNTGSVEGQLNPHMHELVRKRAAHIHLRNKPCAVIALGDDRYRYKAKAGDYLTEFLLTHHGTPLLPPFTVMNEPYDQEERIAHFGDELLTHMKKLPVGTVE